ncbi:helix-turn-helix domain-containing protein [Sinomonas sp. JGH33]|uniref:Helix-turn-helix domain-containing protein n=1 Tax=Sinomonas terricola TaxID=3110330 RepID=A0ABU5TBW2_9MICC|nr:helix-turn-helix domain-containing protein [Sinomonas sp. JGH33]MEA5457088.1 helix-turn-helix domain-containing protein [Sinomonas sp. JGH33]
MDTDHTEAGNPWGLEALLDVGELADCLRVPVSTVYDRRTRGLGPRGYRFGKRLKLAVSDVRAWIERKRDSGPPALADGRGVARALPRLGRRDPAGPGHRRDAEGCRGRVEGKAHRGEPLPAFLFDAHRRQPVP